MGVDWRGIRQALRVRRAELHLGVNELREKSGVGRTTIYRIENISELPDHVMSLETVEALSSAMGLTLSELFARSSLLQADAPSVTLPSSIAPNQAGAEHPRVSGFAVDTFSAPESDSQRLAALCLRAADRVERPDLKALLQDLVWAFQLAAFSPEQWAHQQNLRREVANRRAQEARRDATNRSTG